VPSTGPAPPPDQAREMPSDGAGTPPNYGGEVPSDGHTPPPGQASRMPPGYEGGVPSGGPGTPPNYEGGTPPGYGGGVPFGGVGLPPQRSTRSTGLIVGLTFAGLVAYSIVNTVLGILIFLSTVDQNGSNYPIIISCTIFLALFGLGAGAGLQFLRKPWATGLGLGFLIGWALWSILSAGFCTGINPDLYT
jgi:hypothetical protein